MKIMKSVVFVAFLAVAHAKHMCSSMSQEFTPYIQNEIGVVNSMIKAHAPHSIGQCNSHAPQPCTDVGPLFQTKTKCLYEAVVPFVEGLQTFEVLNATLGCASDGKSFAVEVKAKVGDLKAWTTVGECFYKPPFDFCDKCSDFIDSDEHCCGKDIYIDLSIELVCAKNQTDVAHTFREIDLTKLDMDNIKIGFTLPVIHKYVDFDITEKVEDALRAKIKDFLNMRTLPCITPNWVYGDLINQVAATKCTPLDYINGWAARALPGSVCGELPDWVHSLADVEDVKGFYDGMTYEWA